MYDIVFKGGGDGMTNLELYVRQINMMNQFLQTGAMSVRDYEKSMGCLTEKMGYLIKDTTKEERERIVAESLGNIDGSCDGCMAGLADMYRDYIDGKRELKEINMSFRAGYVYDDDLPQKADCGYK